MAEGLVRTGFTEDLKLGNEVEGVLAQALLAQGSTIEVKSDRRAKDTGNIYVELKYKGKPSGITASEAEWWAYEIEGRFFVMRRSVMKDLAKRAFMEGRVASGGDYDLTIGALVPVEWLVFRERA